MKKILYIIDDGQRNFTYLRISGFSESIRRAEEPINMYIFRSGGFKDYEALQNSGEYNIYHLPDFSDYDGIFLDINSCHNAEINLYGSRGASYVTEAAAASGKPVITLANLIPGFYYVGIDNRAAMTSMISYLHEELRLRNFWFLMGPSDNFENRERTAALKDYCLTNGLPSDNDRFYAESYAPESGFHGFNNLLSAHNGVLPDAVICANDLIALGAFQAAAMAGYSIPKDLFITGFDNLELSSFFSPSLTTVDQLGWTMGSKCIELMQRIWKGEDVPLINYTPTRLIIRESTGSSAKLSEEHLRDQVIDGFRTGMEAETFGNHLNTMQFRLPGCNSVEEMCGALLTCLPSLQCKGLYLVLDKELYDYGNQIEFDQATGQIKSSNSGLKTEGYPEKMELVFSWEEETGASYPKRTIRGIFPAFDSDVPGRDYLFAPLHFMDAAVGYLVIRDCVEMLRAKRIAPIVNMLTMAMRSFFSGKKLEYLNQMLSGISMQDSLTGLCNRLGYHHLATRLFKKTHEEGRSLVVLFIDMDRMKYFNDTFGHACGDDAILCVSSAIKANVPEEAIPVRYGGDEFLVLTPAEGADAVRELLEKILSSIVREALNRHMPETPEISTGFVLTDPASGTSLNGYVEEADRLMYGTKKEKKRNRK